MNGHPLYDASVPVFLGVLDRLGAMLDRGQAALGQGLDRALETRPAPGMMSAARQVATAAQFTLRIACPLAGQRVVEPAGGMDGAGLRDRLAATGAVLRGFDPAAFAGAETRLCRTVAGFAEVALPGTDFLHRFGLPNLYFHQAMAHVALKSAGVPLGKADFDGLHDYPEGFSLG